MPVPHQHVKGGDGADVVAGSGHYAVAEVGCDGTAEVGQYGKAVAGDRSSVIVGRYGSVVATNVCLIIAGEGAFVACGSECHIQVNQYAYVICGPETTISTIGSDDNLVIPYDQPIYIHRDPDHGRYIVEPLDPTSMLATTLTELKYEQRR